MRAALIIAGAAIAACGDSRATPAVTPITACPDGAVLEGAAPPNGLRQRCQKSEGIRHGAGREWYPDGRERSYTEWWNGSKHGRFVLRFDDGRIRSEGAHHHGAPAGTWRYFAENGVPLQVRTFPVAPPPADWLARAIAGDPPEDVGSAAVPPTGADPAPPAGAPAGAGW